MLTKVGVAISSTSETSLLEEVGVASPLLDDIKAGISSSQGSGVTEHVGVDGMGVAMLNEDTAKPDAMTVSVTMASQKDRDSGNSVAYNTITIATTYYNTYVPS